MTRRCIIVLVFFGPIAGGCSSSQNERPQASIVTARDDSIGHKPYAYLNFDRHPSEDFSPQAFNGRAEWPAVNVGASLGEVSLYEETLIDYERDFPARNNNTIRRTVSRRTGVSIRR